MDQDALYGLYSCSKLATPEVLLVINQNMADSSHLRKPCCIWQKEN